MHSTVLMGLSVIISACRSLSNPANRCDHSTAPTQWKLPHLCVHLGNFHQFDSYSSSFWAKHGLTGSHLFHLPATASAKSRWLPGCLAHIIQQTVSSHFYTFMHCDHENFGSAFVWNLKIMVKTALAQNHRLCWHRMALIMTYSKTILSQEGITLTPQAQSSEFLV